MKMIHYPNKRRCHLVTIVPMVPFTPKSTSKLRSALLSRNSVVIPASFPALIRLKPTNHYNHGFYNTFSYNHFTNSE